MILARRLNGRSLQNVLSPPAFSTSAVARTRSPKAPKKDWVQTTDPLATLHGPRLAWILRYAAPSKGLYMRPDGYVLVSALVETGLFKLQLEQFQHLVASDPLKRLQMMQTPSGQWWIRATSGHEIQSVNSSWKEVTKLGRIKNAIYVADLNEWESISKEGIPVNEESGHIRLFQKLPIHLGFNHPSSLICVHINVQQTLLSGISLYIRQNREIITEGDMNGRLMPNLFRKAVNVEWTKDVLWDQETSA